EEGGRVSIAAISGKAYWLRAKDLGADGASVATWPDQSGHGRTAVSMTGHGNAKVADGSTPLGGKSVRFATPAAILLSHRISASSGDPTDLLFDGGGVYYNSAASSGEQWIEIDLGAPVVVTEYILQRYANQGIGTDWDFQGWDGSTWVTLHSQAGYTWTSGV